MCRNYAGTCPGLPLLGNPTTTSSKGSPDKCPASKPTKSHIPTFSRLFTLPSDVDEDDWIEFGLMGAYTQASLTPFNGFDRRDQYWVEDVYTGKDQQPE